MATIGQALTAPEGGWRRIDDTHSSFIYDSGWIYGTHTSYEGGGRRLSSIANSSFRFKFKGTQLRVIGGVSTTDSTQVKISIDGIESLYSSQNATTQFKTLVFEKLGLSDIWHEVVITNMQNVASTFDAIDINSGGEMEVKIGQQLTAPEGGWKRYDDINPAFVSTWVTNTQTQAYGGVRKHDNKTGSSLYFHFTGKKIRIINIIFASYSPDVHLEIDGVKYNFSEYHVTDTIHQALVFEKIDLENKRHTVRMYSTDGKYVGLDAIDIDSTGRLFHPDEVTDPKDLAVGKRIRCNYKSATSGQVGTFSGLGQETKDFTPPASSATPNGDFYYICVDKDHLGRWKLIADRNIQHSISWDTLNTAGIASGSGIKNLIPKMTTNSERDFAFTTRLLTGGTASTDKDNEWDKYIGNSTLGGAITSGDNNVWNWSEASTLTSTVSSLGGSTQRSVRGNSLTNYTYIDSSTASSSLFFRPVLLIENIFVQLNKSFILLNGEYKKLIEGNKANQVNITPKATTSYDNPFNVTESSNYTTYYGWNVFNDTPDTFWMADSTRPVGGHWITVDFKVKKTIGKIGLKTRNMYSTAQWGLKNWNLYGSNDNEKFTLIGSYTQLGDANIQYYDINNKNEYQYYRINTLDNYSVDKPQQNTIEKLEVFEFIPAIPSSWQTVSATLPSLDTFKDEGIDDLSVFDRKATTLTQTMTSEVLGAGKVMKSKVDLKKYFELNGLNVK